MTAAEIARESRALQGLDPTITDPTALQRIAKAVRGSAANTGRAA
jgi:hypothetical protein